MVIAPAEHHDADQNVQGEKDENEANGALLAALQGVVPAEMQGRVFTLLQSAAGLMIPLGLAIAGPLAEVIGVRAWFLVAGIAMAVTGVLALFVPAIVHLEDRAEGKAAKTTGGGDPSVVAPVAQ